MLGSISSTPEIELLSPIPALVPIRPVPSSWDNIKRDNKDKRLSAARGLTASLAEGTLCSGSHRWLQGQSPLNI